MIGRRTFLQWGTAAPLLLNQTTGAGASETFAQNTLVVVDGIDAATDAGRLSTVMQAFAAAGLPVTYVIDPMPAGRRALTPQGALGKVLRDQKRALPGLTELAPLVPELAGLTPYFQARAIHDAQMAYHLGIWGVDRAPATQTVVCDMLPSPFAPSGARAGGIRNVLMRPGTTTPVATEAWQDGVARMIGGQRVSLQTPEPDYRMPRNATMERVLYLDAVDFERLPAETLAADATTFAGHLLTRNSASWISPILATDIQFRDAFGFQKNLGLHFLVGAEASPEDRARLADFRAELADAGIPSSFGADPGQTPQDGYWVTVEGDPDADPAETALTGFSVVAGRAQPQTTPAAPTGYGMGVVLTDGPDVGLDPDNALHVPTLFIRSREDIPALTTTAYVNADTVIAIRADVLRARPQRAKLRDALFAVSDDGISRVTSVPDFVRAAVPSGPYISHFRRTETYQNRPPPPSAPLFDRASLMDDASVAWSYFERWTNKKTGLCPATVNFSASGQLLHETVTMWDVGSHINALIAAVDLGLISTEEFQQSVRKILPNIAGRRSQSRLLPQGWIATDKVKWGNKNFDGCDAGRLLAALYNLDSHPLAKDKSAPTVAAWDLADVVKDGIIYSVEEGALSSTFRSHCAHYAAWAFRTWGIEVRSPYEVLQNRSDPDGKMALLEVGGHIGPMGAEPLLLEALELGMSPESAYLADVLFAAQLEEYEQTGALMCVSEGPIDRAPWFTYQGLQFDAPDRTWATDTVESLPEHRSKEFRAKNLVISAKASYLWAAYRGDHPYSQKLVSYVRDRAKTQNGFASSIYRNTGKPTQTYSDLNTNAIILQSISRILRAG